MSTESYAGCYRTGEIEIVNYQKEGLIYFAKGPRDVLQKVISARARHSYSNDLLIPGVPESSSSNQAIDAVLSFGNNIREELEKNGAKVLMS